MKLYTLLCFLLVLKVVDAQDNEHCSHLGAWTWHLEITGFSNHADLADSLVSLGITRNYVKVSDGSVNTNNWPEIIDVQLVDIYKTRDMEVFAWSYNYPGNDSLQAEALYIAAKTGYQGFVVDVESEFDGSSMAINNIFKAFYKAKQRAINDGLIDDNFKLYCTTWGNPEDHDFYISIIDPYVDGYLAQTYVEQWGPSFVENLEYWIGVGNEEYHDLGATKPVHHILAIQHNSVSAERVNAFFATAGPESSIWRIPGGGVSQATWKTWDEVNWDIDFCDVSMVSDILNENPILIYPNPVHNILSWKVPSNFEAYYAEILNSRGISLRTFSIVNNATLDVSDLNPGLYYLKINLHNKTEVLKFFKS